MRLTDLYNLYYMSYISSERSRRQARMIGSEELKRRFGVRRIDDKGVNSKLQVTFILSINFLVPYSRARQ